LVACAGAAPGEHVESEAPTVHGEGQAVPFSWNEARVTAGGLLAVRRIGELRTIAVEDDGTARIEVVFSTQRSFLNGHELDAPTDAATLRFISAREGGVAGAMSMLGRPVSGEALVAMLLPFAWPPVASWPAVTDAEQTVGVSVGGADGAVNYRRLPSAPPGVRWVTLHTAMSFPVHDRREERVEIGGVVAFGGDLEVSARLAFALPNREGDGGTEVEMHMGDGVPLPEPVPGGLLTCVQAVRAQRTRFDSVPLPPFVLNRPVSEELMAEGSTVGVGPGLLLDLREESGAGRLRGLFEGLDEPLPSRDTAALGVRLEARVRAVAEAMALTAGLTGLPAPAEPEASVPLYLLADASAPASRIIAIAAFARQAGHEARLVVRRPTSEIGDGTSLRGSVWPLAERLAERATDCPFIRDAVAELRTRDVVASPGWVRAVVAGGLGTCGCDAVMAEQLADVANQWADVNRQSWGWLDLQGLTAPAGAPVATLIPTSLP